MTLYLLVLAVLIAAPLAVVVRLARVLAGRPANARRASRPAHAPACPNRAGAPNRTTRGDTTP